MRTKPLGAAVYGIDLGKTSFHVVGTDVKGNLLQRVTLNRSNIFEFFANASVALIGMEVNVFVKLHFADLYLTVFGPPKKQAEYR